MVTSSDFCSMGAGDVAEGKKESYAEGLIFSFGGLGPGSQTLSDANKFDSATQVWHKCAPLPQPIMAAASVVAKGCIFLLGGVPSKEGLPMASVFVYNIAKDSWSLGPPLPQPRHRHAAVLVNESIFVMGGMTADGVPDTSMFRYDLLAKAWTKCVATLPYARFGFSAVVVRDEIYALGGKVIVRGKPMCVSTVHKYNIPESKWIPCADMHRTRVDFGAVVINQSIYVRGGQSVNEHTNKMMKDDVVEQYDVDKDTWSVYADASHHLVRRAALGVVGIGPKIYCVGGIDEHTLALVDCFDTTQTDTPNTETDTPKPRSWTVCSAVPVARKYSATVAVVRS